MFKLSNYIHDGLAAPDAVLRIDSVELLHTATGTYTKGAVIKAKVYVSEAVCAASGPAFVGADLTCIVVDAVAIGDSPATTVFTSVFGGTPSAASSADALLKAAYLALPDLPETSALLAGATAI